MVQALFKRLFYLHEIIDFIAIVGGMLALCGTYWDIRYHIDVGRDSFWIPPHFMIYSGVMLFLLGSVLALWQERKVKNNKISKPLFIALGVVFGCVLVQLFSAYFDDWWHDRFGLDVTVWSPPHFMLLGAAVLITLSCIYFQRFYMHLVRVDRSKKVVPDEIRLEWMWALVLGALNILVAEFEYFRTTPLSHLSQLRPTWLFLFLLVLEFSFVFTLSKTFMESRWSATRIAFFYSLIRLALSWVLSYSGSWPIPPQLVIIPAIVYDLGFERNVKRAAGVAFLAGVLFYGAELLYLPVLGLGRFLPHSFLDIFLVSGVAALVALLAYSFGNKLRSWALKKPS